jgi:hypothetical protein
MDSLSFLHAANGTSGAAGSTQPEGAVVYSSSQHTVVKPIPLTHVEKKAFAFAVTYIYKHLHEAICNDLQAKIQASHQSLDEILGTPEDRRDLYLLGLDEMEFNSNRPQYLSIGLEQLRNESDLFRFLSEINFAVFGDNIVKHSQIFHKVFSTLYSRMHDAKGLELLDHVKGMWALGSIICRFDGRARHMERSNAGLPRIVDSVWVEEPTTGEDLGLEQWMYASNILQNIAIMPIEVVYSGLNELVRNYEDYHVNIGQILETLFFHPVSVQFWTDFFSYNSQICVNEGKPIKLTYYDVFPPGVRRVWPFIVFSWDNKLKSCLNELYARFGIAEPSHPTEGVNPMFLSPASSVNHSYGHFYHR